LHGNMKNTKSSNAGNKRQKSEAIRSLRRLRGSLSMGEESGIRFLLSAEH